MRRRPSPRGCLLMEERARERCVFSPDGGSLAICGLDGEVKVWDSATGSMVLKFSPSGARGQPISSAAWSRTCEHHPHKHKRRKSGAQPYTFLALAVGSKVVVWNITKGEQEARLSVHSEPVTSVAWGPGNGLLYSASLDKHVAEWSVATRDCSHKWQADKHGVRCICCHDSSDLLLTAGRSIKLWNTSNHSLIKKFAGHATSVAYLAFIGDSLFLSCATNDRVINLWGSGSPDSTAVASLTCEREVVSCDVAVDDRDRTLRAAALTEEGVVHLFKYPLTNQITAPITAHSTIQFATAGAKSDTPSPLPILTALLSTSGLTVAHSSAVKPTIETLSSSECEGRVCLVREGVTGLLLQGQGKRQANKPHSHSVTVLGPGNMTIPTDHTHKSKLSNRITEESPLSSRLDTEKSSSAGPGLERESRVATADSLSRLLSQAVQSGDPALLEEVLSVRKESTIRQTVCRLPLPHIVPFLQQLIQRVQNSPHKGLELSVWVKCVLTQHSSFLMTQPHLVSVLSSFYQVLEARSSVYSKLCRVHGKLELMMISGSTERKQKGRKRGGREEEVHSEAAGASSSNPVLSVMVGDEVAGRGAGDNSSSEESEAPSDLSENEEEGEHSGSNSDVAMDTTEQQELT